MTKIELQDGKYTIIHDNGRGLHALRYGEEWRNLAGDDLVMAMAQEIEELQERIDETETLLDESFDAVNELDYEGLHERIYDHLYGGDSE